MSVPLFPLAEYWWLYAAFTAGVLVLLALDLGVFRQEAHAVGVREAATWTVVWIVLEPPVSSVRGPLPPGPAGRYR